VSADYTALRIRASFCAVVPNGSMVEDDRGFEDASDPLCANRWDFDEIEARRIIVDEARAHIEPLYAHLASLGCVRADNPTEDETPFFYLIIRGRWEAPSYLQDGTQGQPWLNFGMVTSAMVSIPGANFSGCGSGEYARPPEIFDALRSLAPGREIAAWGGDRTPDSLPQPHETCQEWLNRVARPADQMVTAFDRLARVGYDLTLYSLFFEPSKAAETEWLVEGVIGFGAVTLLVGCGASGKSSALHELLSATNAINGPKEFLGRRLSGRYPGVLLSGEEPEGAIKHRQDRHSGVWEKAEPMIIAGAEPRHLSAALMQLRGLPGKGLLAVDPATTFLDGDETKTHVVSEFYGPLVAFARQKDWAVVVAHHLVKDPPKSLSRILSSVKGSTVHTDRARMVIAMIDRRNGTVEVGPIKHNYPEGAWLNVDQGQFFRRDPETFRLLPVDAEMPKSPPPEGELLALIYSVLVGLNDGDVKVHRTGSSGIYKLQIAELHGVPRNVVENGVLALLKAGRVINTDKGLVAVRTPQLHQSISKEHAHGSLAHGNRSTWR
jgi:hypothetical protein